ncbi:uncharacterized protein LOC122533851 [Frieseomelitta varia]|uniref:uncharacterized protein LOC122533851 n=1 Tax=Frieseomelitta varia TaxID=561572 RepID=UPI001CB6A990|nr:uncharacterized protein LOC122533851 [Frieseomelitta varia]
MATSRSPIRTRSGNSQEEPRAQQEEDNWITALAFKSVPPFMKEEPEFWFIQAEAAMKTAKIANDEGKYFFLLSQLRPEILRYAADIVRTPPALNKYDTLKQRLLDLYDQTEEARVRQILKTCRMGDEKPSHYVHRLRSLAGGRLEESLLTSIFLAQVPQNLHDILMDIENKDLTKLATIADMVMEIQTPHAAPITHGNMATSFLHQRPEAPRMDASQFLVSQMAEILRRFTALEVRETQREQQPRWRGRSGARSRSRSSSAGRTTGHCYYHRRFGAKAYRCSIPCAWKPKPGETNIPTIAPPAEN